MNSAASTPPYSHDFHAEAHVLSGDLQRPVEQKIEQHTPVKLAGPRGGHLTRETEEVSIEGLITFAKGHTRVSGSRSLKHDGWVTLSTSILKGLNVFEVITADRIVSQVSTDHPFVDGHVPNVSFLGSQFNNVQVSGIRLDLKLNFGICGERPPDRKTYFQSAEFLDGVKKQTEAILKDDDLPKEMRGQYDKKLDDIKKLLDACKSKDPGRHDPIVCSLVESIGKIPIPGVKIFGHILLIPNFGTVALGEIEVRETMYDDSPTPNPYFQLTGIKMNMGCVGHGMLAAATTIANGHNHP
jgi:hypothetical protein